MWLEFPAPRLDKRKAIRISGHVWVSTSKETPSPEAAWQAVNIDPDAEADVFVRVNKDTVEIDSTGDGVADFSLTVSDFKSKFPFIDLGSL